MEKSALERRIKFEQEMRTAEDGLFVQWHPGYNCMPKGSPEQVRKKLIREVMSDNSCISHYFHYERGRNNKTSHHDPKRSKVNYSYMDHKDSCVYFCKNGEFSEEFQSTQEQLKTKREKIKARFDQYEMATNKKEADRIHSEGKKVYRSSQSEKFWELRREKLDRTYNAEHCAFIKMIIKDQLKTKHNAAAAEA